MSERPDDLVGTVLDARFRVELVLGAAHAGGTVYRGRDVDAGTKVIIRCPAIPEGLKGTALEAALTAFDAEAALLAKISLASGEVERLLARGVEERNNKRVVYTIFESLAGRSVEHHIAQRGGTSSIGEALVILEPAARALGTAHALGAAHGDVRPGNLWLAEGGGRTTLKVAAFGLATMIGGGEALYAPEYAAPEHFKRSYGPIGPATDVYGLALIVIEMVTGTRGLPGNAPGDLYLATSNLLRRPTLRVPGSHVSDALEAVIQRAVAVDPRRRFGSARELWEALLAAVPELTPAPPSIRSRPSDRPPGLVSLTPPARGRDSAPEGAPAGLSPISTRGPSSSQPPAAGDARLISGNRKNPVTARSSEVAREPQADRTGAWAWIAVVALGVIAVGVVVAKVRAGAGAKTSAVPSASVSASAMPRAAASATEESAVTVQPFRLDMVKVTPGTFVMGSDHEGKPEKPAHPVTLTHAFYIDRTEVRADAYAACVEAEKCTPSRVHSGDVLDTTVGCNTDKPTHPANCIDRIQAEAYCTFAHKRLPTEAEWEYAARGSDNREFPWGNAAPTTCAVAIVSGVSGPCGERKGTWEVGTTLEGKSAFGALDMAGNVWEWVADGYDAYPPAQDEAGAATLDPKVPMAPGGRGVLRGGSWDYVVVSAKATYRLPFQANAGSFSTGFRCARDAE